MLQFVPFGLIRSFALALGVNVVIVGLFVGYWTRSERVLAVFGSRGLGLLRSERG